MKVPLSKELLNDCATASNQYKINLEDGSKKKGKTEQTGKRNGTEDESEELRKKRSTVANVCKSLDADSLAEKFENTMRTKMAELITQSLNPAT